MINSGFFQSNRKAPNLGDATSKAYGPTERPSEARMSDVILIQDTREQNGWQGLFESPCTIETVACGDYTIKGMEHLAAVERKSKEDLVQSLTHERRRFEAELAKSRAYHFFAVIAECSLQDILTGNFRGEANPKSIFESVCCFAVRYAPFLFGGNRETAARLAESLLLKFCREHYRTIERFEKAQAEEKARNSA
jgi:DNA excision repair protein ERCC-4